MVSMNRNDGTRSRTMKTLALLAVLTAVEGSLVTYYTQFADRIPTEYLWAYPVVHTVMLAWMAYLRATTTQPLQK